MSKSKKKRPKQSASAVSQFTRRHRRWLRRIAVVAGLAAALVAFVFVATRASDPPTAIDASGQEVRAGVLDRAGASPRAGSHAPNFLLPDYDRKAVRLDDFEGKVVFVNFWASWCTFCEAEMPDIVRIAERFPDDVVVIAVNRGESKGTAEKWTNAHDFPELANMRWVLDSQESVVREYRVDGMPQSFFIDENGEVRLEVRRVTEFDEMLATVEQILGPDGHASGA